MSVKALKSAKTNFIEMVFTMKTIFEWLERKNSMNLHHLTGKDLNCSAYLYSISISLQEKYQSSKWKTRTNEITKRYNGRKFLARLFVKEWLTDAKKSCVNLLNTMLESGNFPSFLVFNLWSKGWTIFPLLSNNMIHSLTERWEVMREIK